MAKVGIITAFFPYGTPEQFFEPEVLAWADSPHEVVLLPMRSGGRARPVPPGVTVDLSLAVFDSWRGKGTPRALLSALTSRSVWREIRSAARPGRLGLRRLAEIVSTEAQARFVADRVGKVARRHGGFDTVYSYWHGVGAYGATVALREGAPIGRVVARAHRVDVYEEFRTSGHHPRKRDYVGDIDLHAAISDEGADYLIRTFGVPQSQVSVARLGCAVDGHRAPVSDPGQLEILSTSFVQPIKRVPQILDAVRAVALALPGIQVRWTHLGGGPGLEDLRAHADQATAPNLTVRLTGQVGHDDVLDFLRSHPVDIFVNYSTSEGVPVSIMEAMSVGVPAVAPSVGGVAELVDSTVGELLPADASVDDLVAALLRLQQRCKGTEVREAAAGRVRDHYDAARNFARFVAEVGG